MTVMWKRKPVSDEFVDTELAWLDDREPDLVYVRRQLDPDLRETLKQRGILHRSTRGIGWYVFKEDWKEAVPLLRKQQQRDTENDRIRDAGWGVEIDKFDVTPEVIHLARQLGGVRFPRSPKPYTIAYAFATREKRDEFQRRAGIAR